jgi:hypothetical protein
MEPAGSGATWPKPARVSTGAREAKDTTISYSSNPDIRSFARPPRLTLAGLGHVAPLSAGSFVTVV